MKLSTLAPLPALALLAACATTSPPMDSPPRPGPTTGQVDPGPGGEQTSEADLEPIYAASLGRAGLTVRVNSNGCTKKSDFTTQLLDGWPGSTLILKRTRPDLCRAFVAGGAELVFGYGELGLKPNGQIVLANPLTSDPTPGR
jgi:hypothetical protein